MDEEDLDRIIEELDTTCRLSDEDFRFLYPDGLQRSLGTVSLIFQSFFGVDRYPAVHDKAAAILYFLIVDHHMIDGNKRFATLTAEVFLEKNGYRSEIPDKEYILMTLGIADEKKRPTLAEVRGWMANRVHHVNG